MNTKMNQNKNKSTNEDKNTGMPTHIHQFFSVSPYLDTDEYVPYICKHGKESDCAVCMNYSDEEEIREKDSFISDSDISSS